MEPDAVEIRVLGCLIEKQRTTPDVYPLTLNALRLACNQSTNRDPVVDYDENTIRSGIERLNERELVASLGKRPGQREERYAHLLAAADEVEQSAPVDGQELPAQQAPDRLERLERELA